MSERNFFDGDWEGYHPFTEETLKGLREQANRLKTKDDVNNSAAKQAILKGSFVVLIDSVVPFHLEFIIVYLKKNKNLEKTSVFKLKTLGWITH